MIALNASKKSAWRRAGIAVVVVVLVVALILVLLELFLVPVINRVLDESVKDHKVQIADVELAPWRGAYAVEGLTVRERKSKMKNPLLEVPRIDAAVDLKALLQGAFVGSLTLERPVVRVIVENTKKNQEVHAPDLDVAKAIGDLLPLRLNRMAVNDGRAFLLTELQLPSGGTRKLDLQAKNIDVRVENLTNSDKLSGNMFANAKASAALENFGDVKAKGKLNPTAKQPTFDLDAQLTGLPLTQLSDWSLAFGRFKFEAGRLDIFTEVAAKDGAFKGYVKPLGTNVKTEGMHQDAVSKVVAQVVETASELLENKKTDRAGTKIELEGRFDQPQIDVWTAVWTTLQNAFIKALRPVVDGDIDLASVEAASSP
jgi:Domain of Unknown Function (DUF748)